MPPESAPTLDQLVDQLKAFMPTKAPAWLVAFGQYLMAHFPEIVAAIMKLIPAAVTSSQQTALSCCCCMYDASQDTGLKGPVTDPFVKAALDAFKQFLITQGPKALDALEQLAIEGISKITP